MMRAPASVVIMAGGTGGRGRCFNRNAGGIPVWPSDTPGMSWPEGAPGTVSEVQP